jgi:hypothetical protein
MISLGSRSCDEQQCEIVIAFVHNNSGLPVLDLRAMSDQELSQLALEWSLTSAVSLRQALVAAKWRGEDLPTAKQLEDMSLKDRLANLEGFRNSGDQSNLLIANLIAIMPP